jgi:ribosomal protein S12 methylthiotransferase
MKEEKVHFVSLGCPKNLVDSEIMAGSLISHGYQIHEQAAGADTVIVNTCGFIEDSKKESIQKILEMADLKSSGQIQRLVVAGCLSQRYKSELVNDLPEADIFVGSGEFQNINQILKDHDAGKASKEYFNLPTFLQTSETPRVNSQPSHRAYLKISEGCLKRCAFCAIPLIRGNLQSRRLEGVIQEAQNLALKGVKELLIISHDFTDYGWDLRRKEPSAKESPAQLLRELCKVKGIEWIRMLYLYPDGISPELIEVIKTEDKIVKYFDMPLQHISDEMLKRMNRKMTRDEIETVLQNIREQIPNAHIRTQFIVGFPGETEEHFQEMLSFISSQKFDRVGCFKYSPEENTPGGKMVDQTLRVLVEGTSEESELLLQGRYYGQAPDIDGVVLINEGYAVKGDFVNVKISKSFEYDLLGAVVDTDIRNGLTQ